MTRQPQRASSQVSRAVPYILAKKRDLGRALVALGLELGGKPNQVAMYHRENELLVLYKNRIVKFFPRAECAEFGGKHYYHNTSLQDVAECVARRCLPVDLRRHGGDK